MGERERSAARTSQTCRQPSAGAKISKLDALATSTCESRMRNLTYHTRLKVDVWTLRRSDVVVGLLLRQLEPAKIGQVSKGRLNKKRSSVAGTYGLSVS